MPCTKWMKLKIYRLLNEKKSSHVDMPVVEWMSEAHLQKKKCNWKSCNKTITIIGDVIEAV